MNPPIDPATPLAVMLEAQEVNLLLAIIRETTGFPLRVTGPLHAKIESQAQAAAAAAAEQSPIPPLSNGADSHVSD